MNDLRCPHLDRLGRELIDAYRNLDDHGLLPLYGSPDHPVRQIHLAMTEHRKGCAICQQRAHERERAAMLVDSYP
jgi:hypothetical protein